MVDQTKVAKVVSKDVKALLEGSYKEVLDAVKHQDDKIGRLFTGISFLTAAALAMANLGSAKYLSQRYSQWQDVPPAMLSLGAYLLLILMAVTILIGSLATPLRVPGLSRGRRKATVDWVGPPSSQIYFGEISKLGLDQWEQKWTGTPQELETELTQTLVGETHNLAVRTQFKYGRMNEAIALFNLALLFLAITMIFCVSAASSKGVVLETTTVPDEARWSLAASVAVFFYLQLLGQVRYTRQTIDELVGWENMVGGALRYVWVLSASAWVLLVGSDRFVDGCRVKIVWALAIIAILGLGAGTFIQRRVKGLSARREPIQWIGPLLALLVGSVLSYLSTTADEHGHGIAYSLNLVLIAAAVLTGLAILSPTLNVYRTARRYRADLKGADIQDADATKSADD